MANRNGTTDYVVAVEDGKVRRLNWAEELEYEKAILSKY